MSTREAARLFRLQRDTLIALEESARPTDPGGVFELFRRSSLQLVVLRAVPWMNARHVIMPGGRPARAAVAQERRELGDA